MPPHTPLARTQSKSLVKVVLRGYTVFLLPRVNNIFVDERSMMVEYRARPFTTFLLIPIFLKNCNRSLSSPQQSTHQRGSPSSYYFRLPIVYFLLSSFIYRVFMYSIITQVKNFSSSHDGNYIVMGRAILCVLCRYLAYHNWILTSFLRVVRFGRLRSPAWRHVLCVWYTDRGFCTHYIRAL